jgi:hypothetical protein
MTFIYHAFTLQNSISEVTIFNVPVIAFSEYNSLSLEYNYGSPKNSGWVKCNFNVGFYEGHYQEDYNNNHYSGEVQYLVTKIDNKVYIHGTWFSNHNYNGYDFFAGQ